MRRDEGGELGSLMENSDKFTLDREAYTKAANDALASMRHKEGRWWRYSASHGTLDLVVGEPIGQDNIALCLAACEHIAGPVCWPKQKLEVVWNSNQPSQFVIQDESVGFKAVGKHFVWRRNFDLLKSGSAHLGTDGV